MKKTAWIVPVLIAAVALAGCAQKQAAVSETPQTEEEDIQTKTSAALEADEAEDEMKEEAKADASGGAEEDADTEDAASQPVQDFTSLDITVGEGTLYIRTGSEFSLTRHDGKALSYEIADQTLSFSASQSGDAVLVLPEAGSYETFRLTLGNGHVYVESALAVHSLELEVGQGEASLADVDVSDSTSIQVRRGSLFLSGNPGASVTADCQEGHLSLELSVSEEDYNYDLKVSGGNLSLGRHSYHGRSDSVSLDNNASSNMALACTHGDISVTFLH